MAEYLRPLWLGGGISREALEIVEYEIRLAAEAYRAYPPGVREELHNLANAAYAELTKAPPKPVCDLI